MARNSKIVILEESDRRLRILWKHVLGYIKSDLAYVWSDEVKNDFEKIKNEAGKLAFILKKIHGKYKEDSKKYDEEISHIRELLRILNRIESKPQWVKKMNSSLQDIIKDIREEKRIDETTRRDFLKFGTRAASVLLVPIRTAEGAQKLLPVSKCRFTVEQVRQGKITPQLYLNERLTCVPEIAEAYKKGIIAGILFDPLEAQVSKLIESIYAKVVKDRKIFIRDSKVLKSIMSHEVSLIMQGKHGITEDGFAGATHFPSAPYIVGTGVKSYLVIYRRELFDIKANDEGITGTIVHELTHAEDHHLGIKIGNFHLDNSRLTTNYSWKFLKSIGELRAYHEQFKIGLRLALQKQGELRFKWNKELYIKYWNEVYNVANDMGADSFLRSLARLQLEAYKDLIPQNFLGRQAVKFNMFGMEDFVE